MAIAASPEGKTEAKPAEPKPEPLQYKTWDLKVTINCECEGCKKRVEDILRNIEGVYTVAIDWTQQKVGVTGNVDSETLIEKLKEKWKGKVKYAGLWPQNGDQHVTPQAGSQSPLSGSEGGGEPEVVERKENPEPLQYKTWDLKVTINCECEGCKERVEDILRNIEGVYTVAIDWTQQKVGVTGNVDSETLIKKLKEKWKGKVKYAGLWPQNGDQHVTPQAGSQSPLLGSEGGVGGQNNAAELPRGSWGQQIQLHPHEGSSHSTRPLAPSSSGSNSINYQRPTDQPESPSHVSPAEAAGIIALLKDKSVDELRELLSDKETYNQFLLSVDQVKTQNSERDELRKENLQLTRSNSKKEEQIMELKNRCMIIRTTELTAAQEKLSELERQKEDIIMNRLREANNKTDEESEELHRQLLDGEIDLKTFLHKYKKLRNIYHRREQIYPAAK